jgi:hypothetical protein
MWYFLPHGRGKFMSTWLIAAMGVVYFVVAIDQFMKGGIGTGIMFIGYAMGNVGLVMVAK